MGLDSPGFCTCADKVTPPSDLYDCKILYLKFLSEADIPNSTILLAHKHLSVMQF